MIGHLQIPIDRGIRQELEISDGVAASLHTVIRSHGRLSRQHRGAGRFHHVTKNGRVGGPERLRTTAKRAAGTDEIAKRVDVARLREDLRAGRFGVSAANFPRETNWSARCAALSGNLPRSALPRA